MRQLLYACAAIAILPITAHAQRIGTPGSAQTNLFPNGVTIGGALINSLAINGSATTPSITVNGAGSSLGIKAKGAGTGIVLTNDSDSDSLFMEPGNGGAGPAFVAEGPETNISIAFQTKGASSQFYFSTPGESDSLAIQTSTAGSGPDIYALGPESAVALSLWAKGPYGVVYVASVNAQGGTQFGFLPGQYSGAAPGPAIEAAGTPAAIPVVLVPKGGAPVASYGHLQFIGPAPTVSACGTSPTIDGAATDAAFTVTEGTSATGCTVTFNAAFGAAPHCVVSSPSGSPFTSYTTTTTTLTIVNASASGNKYSGICM